MSKFSGIYGLGKRVPFKCSKPSRTKQSFRDECDINSIMSKWQKHGVLTHLNRFEGSYGDFISAEDYHTSMNQCVAANDAFMSLPSKLRERFLNDPARFLSFVQDPGNRDEMMELGLLRKPLPGSDVKPAQSASHIAGDGAGDLPDGGTPSGSTQYST